MGKSNKNQRTPGSATKNRGARKRIKQQQRLKAKALTTTTTTASATNGSPKMKKRSPRKNKKPSPNNNRLQIKTNKYTKEFKEKIKARLADWKRVSVRNHYFD